MSASAPARPIVELCLASAREAESGRGFVTRGTPLLDQGVIEQELRRGGVDHLLVRTDQPFVHRLRQFFRARGLAGRGAR